MPEAVADMSNFEYGSDLLANNLGSGAGTDNTTASGAGTDNTTALGSGGRSNSYSDSKLQS